ncbi:prefoldin subunit beta [Candidatus Woesearchaeota archaeon]|nr:prefoldin subunit beta [Candidatus Woesearchaeota archaeon]
MSAKINQLQLLQQNLQNILLQKQQFESQLSELDSALHELKTTDKAYKVLGHIMVASSPELLAKDLDEKKEVLQIRIKNFDRQEESIKKNIESLQQEVVAELENNKHKK